MGTRTVLGIFLDTETNGLNAFKHRVIEIAFKIVHLQTGELLDHYESIVHVSDAEWELSDKESLKVNGFKLEQVAAGKKPDVVALEITNIFQKNGIRRGSAVFICQNPSFDRIFFSQLIDPDMQEKLHWPYHWLDLASMYWVQGLQKGKTSPEKLPWNTGFSKDKIAKAYALAPEKNPHRAMNGVDHLILCYEKVVGF